MEARREFDLRAAALFAGAFLAGAFFAGARFAGELRADDEDAAETAGADRDEVDGWPLR